MSRYFLRRKARAMMAMPTMTQMASTQLIFFFGDRVSNMAVLLSVKIYSKLEITACQRL